MRRRPRRDAFRAVRPASASVSARDPTVGLPVETSSLLAATALFARPCALQARAALPMVNGTCPGAREVHADDGGPVYVNGKETRLKRFNDDYIEAHDPARGVTLSITTSAGGGVQMSHTGQGGANGGCSVGRHDARGGSHDAPVCRGT